MYPWIPQTTSPPVGESSPLLHHLAGDFAPRIAGLWPAPHAVFLTAPAERRHLACLALTLAGDAPLPSAANGLLELSLRRALTAFVPEAPQGLGRALGRLGETAWAAEDYRSLLRLLGFGTAMKPLRHAKAIELGQLRSLAALPNALLEAGFGDRRLTPDQARVLADAFGLVLRNQGEENARAAAARWRLIADLPTLFDALRTDVLPEIATPPFCGTARLKPLERKADITGAAKRFGNCLETRLCDAVTGQTAYYEWTEAPGAIVEIWRDHLHGWRLSEARLHKNAPAPAEMRDAITAELRGMGVHVGLTAWQFETALSAAVRQDFVRPDETQEINALFGVYVG